MRQHLDLRDVGGVKKLSAISEQLSGVCESMEIEISAAGRSGMTPGQGTVTDQAIRPPSSKPSAKIKPVRSKTT